MAPSPISRQPHQIRRDRPLILVPLQGTPTESRDAAAVGLGSEGAPGRALPEVVRHGRGSVLGPGTHAVELGLALCPRIVFPPLKCPYHRHDRGVGEFQEDDAGFLGGLLAGEEQEGLGKNGYEVLLGGLDVTQRDAEPTRSDQRNRRS